MTPKLLLLSHAATTATRAAAFPTGDEPIEPKGLRRLGPQDKRFAGYRCLSSPARSALATAAALRLAPTCEPALADCDYGSWRSRSIEEVQASDPEGLMAWFADPTAAPHGGESLAALVSRVGAWLESDQTKDGRTIAVTHANVIRAVVVGLLGAPPSAMRWIDIAPLCVAELSGGGGRWTLKSLNAGL